VGGGEPGTGELSKHAEHGTCLTWWRPGPQRGRPAARLLLWRVAGRRGRGPTAGLRVPGATLLRRQLLLVHRGRGGTRGRCCYVAPGGGRRGGTGAQQVGVAELGVLVRSNSKQPRERVSA
jgi:hypothetical protein